MILAALAAASIAACSGPTEGGTQDAAAPTCPKTAADSACSDLTDPGPRIAVSCGTDRPAMTGGTILDGTYVLATATRYRCPDGGLGSLPPSEAATFVITGSCIQAVGVMSVSDGGATSERVTTENGVISVKENVLVVEANCSSVVGGPFNPATYTASADTLSLLYDYEYPLLQVFARR